MKSLGSNRLFLVLGNQLFPLEVLRKTVSKRTPIFMAESYDLCTHFCYHKKKILFFLSAMRVYRDELKAAGYTVHYFEMDPKDRRNHIELLSEVLHQLQIQELGFYEIEDRFYEDALKRQLQRMAVSFSEFQSPMFMVSREDFKGYLASVKQPFMRTFYERQRKRTGVLMDRGRPLGGKMSFDAENRKKIPKGTALPDFESTALSASDAVTQSHMERVKELIDKEFATHPGETDGFWLPIDRKRALEDLAEFIRSRLGKFGEFQDAIESQDSFLWHSRISTAINGGLLLPGEIVAAVESAFKKNPNLPLNSVEGFIRQVMGWREFIRGIYQNFGGQQEASNFFEAKRPLGQNFYRAQTGIPPVDDCVNKAVKWGYLNHIERLMVIGSFLCLAETEPRDVYKWFMEYFVDGSDWVMVPNVYGMALFSDGGVFATKPYICGSNYWLKMSNYSRGDWCLEVDGMYWEFIENHKDFFAKNPRMGVMLNSLEKMDSEKKSQLFRASAALKERVSQ